MIHNNIGHQIRILLFAGFIVLNCHAAPTSLLEVIFSGSAIPEAKHLIYSRTPVSWILKARNLGKIARQNLSNDLEREGQTGAEKMALYAEYLNKCSLVDQGFMGEDAAQNGNDDNDDTNDREETPSEFALTLGLDTMTANLFGMSQSVRRAKIGSTCARNELRLQCALGFYRNRMDKLKEHIDTIKQQDGVFKVMLESECQLAAKELDETNNTDSSEEEEDEMAEGAEENEDRDFINSESIFQCVHEKSTRLADACQASFTAYNASRRQMNARIHERFEGTVNVLQRRIERATQSGEQSQVRRALTSGESLLRRSLNQVSAIEASKCRRFAEMVQCMSANVRQMCGQHPAQEMETMLKTGYLRRERGDVLHSQFTELAIETSADCLAAVAST